MNPRNKNNVPASFGSVYVNRSKKLEILKNYKASNKILYFMNLPQVFKSAVYGKDMKMLKAMENLGFLKDLASSVDSLNIVSYKDPNGRIQDLYTLHYLVEEHNLPLLKFFFGLPKEYGIEINALDEQHISLLEMAISDKAEKTVKLLLEAGADPENTIKRNLGDRKAKFITPLQLAILESSSEIVALLLDAHAKTDVLEPVCYNQTTLFYDIACLAADSGHLEIIKLLQAKNYIQPAESVHPFIAAVCSGQTEVVRFYLDAQMDANYYSVPHGQSALSLACKYNHAAEFELLLQRGANCNGHPEEKMPPLCMAATQTNPYFWQKLIDLGARTDCVGSWQQSKFTPIALAIANDSVAHVQYYIEKVALGKMHQDVSLLHLACASGHIPLIDLIYTVLGRTPDLFFVKNVLGETPARILAEKGNLEGLQHFFNATKPKSKNSLISQSCYTQVIFHMASVCDNYADFLPFSKYLCASEVEIDLKKFTAAVYDFLKLKWQAENYTHNLLNIVIQHLCEYPDFIFLNKQKMLNSISASILALEQLVNISDRQTLVARINKALQKQSASDLMITKLASITIFNFMRASNKLLAPYHKQLELEIEKQPSLDNIQCQSDWIKLNSKYQLFLLQLIQATCQNNQVINEISLLLDDVQNLFKDYHQKLQRKREVLVKAAQAQQAKKSNVIKAIASQPMQEVKPNIVKVNTQPKRSVILAKPVTAQPQPVKKKQKNTAQLEKKKARREQKIQQAAALKLLQDKANANVQQTSANIQVILELARILPGRLYLVGGALLSLMQGLPPRDIDLFYICDGKKEIELELFAELKFRKSKNFADFDLLTGRLGQYGIDLKFLPKHDGDSCIERDALQRDFTVCALYLRIYPDGKVSEVIDPTKCGQVDFFNKQLRMIGEPDVRFSEDPVRILRALKYSLTGYQPDHALRQALYSWQNAAVLHEHRGHLEAVMRRYFATENKDLFVKALLAFELMERLFSVNPSEELQQNLQMIEAIIKKDKPSKWTQQPTLFFAASKVDDDLGQHAVKAKGFI